MGDRLALVVGSQCDRLSPPLSFVKECAEGLSAHFAGAGWMPACADGAVLLDPDTATFKAMVEEAFAAADAAGATLLVAFIGHGVATGESDFYLLACDSEAEEPDSETAFHFTQVIQERLRTSTGLDGLVVLVDACQAKEGLEGAATRWTEVLALNGGRAELLVASGAGSAYDGCFTRTILATFQTGLAHRGEALLCGDLHPQINARCKRTRAQHFSYSGANPGSEDRGLWLVANKARSADCVTGRPVAGLIDQLTEGLLLTDTICDTLSRLEESGSARLRLLVGPAGSGKSTLLAVLIRPALVGTLGIGAGYIKAAVFLDRTSTLESISAEIASQLHRTAPGFTKASAAVAARLTEENRGRLSSFDTAVRLPLEHLCRDAPGLRVPLIIDGLDQPQPGAREIIVAAVRQLSTGAGLDRVRVIAGVRDDQGIDIADALPGASTFEIPAPSPAELAEVVSAQLGAAAGRLVSGSDLAQMAATVGGWLIARLLVEITDPTDPTSPPGDFRALVAARLDRARRDAQAGTGHRPSRPGESLDGTAERPEQGRPTLLVERVLGVIAAAGERPVLPIALLAAAVTGGDEQVPLSRIRDAVVALGALVSRGNPGTGRETLGISHQAVLRTLVYCLGGAPALRWAHQAVIEAHQQMPTTPQTEDYWGRAAARHYLGIGQPETAIAVLRARDTPRAADNRDRWAGWLPEITATLGPDHPDTLTTRSNLASWRAEAGDVAGAISEYQVLLAERVRVQGADHPDTLTTRHNLAYCCGEAGDVAGAISDYQVLLAERVRVLGADHPDTLTTRSNLASWRAEAGDVAGAISEYQLLLAERVRVQGADHPATLTTRNNLAYWRAEAGDAAGAIAEFQALLADQDRVLGADHPDTRATRHNLAHWRDADRESGLEDHRGGD